MASLLTRIRAAAEYVEMVRRRPLLLFEITPRCNLECAFCYNVWKAEEDYPSGELPADEVKSMLSKALAESGGRHVTFTGGEPLLRDDLEDIVGHLRAAGVTTTVITNASHLTEARTRSLLEAGVGLFEIPLLAADPATHDSLTGVANFAKAIDGIANVRAAGGRVVAVFVATQLNIGEWPETIRLCLALGVDGILFNRFNPGGAGILRLEELMPTRSSLEKALSEANTCARQFGIGIGIPVPIPQCTIDHQAYPELSFHGCDAGTANAYWTVDPRGNIRPCNHSPTVLGNVRREHFRHITSRAETKAWCAAIPSSCRRCEHVKSCRGGCKASAQVCSGSLEADDPFVRSKRREGVGIAQ